jgi:hypothetical protein
MRGKLQERSPKARLFLPLPIPQGKRMNEWTDGWLAISHFPLPPGPSFLAADWLRSPNSLGPFPFQPVSTHSATALFPSPSHQPRSSFQPPFRSAIPNGNLRRLPYILNHHHHPQKEEAAIDDIFLFSSAQKAGGHHHRPAGDRQNFHTIRGLFHKTKPPTFCALRLKRISTAMEMEWMTRRLTETFHHRKLPPKKRD